MSQAFNMSFRMYMEGVLTPFKSANVICTPNGVEASINVYANRHIYDIKPKTAVQIFYKDWIADKSGKLGWRLMFDGFTSAYYKVDEATQGRQVSITCRDFRADIRRTPAALAYTGEESLSSKMFMNMEGIFTTTVVKGFNDHKFDTREYGGQLNPLSQILKLMAGTAYGKGAKPASKQKNGEFIATGAFGTTMQVDERGKAKCGSFLDGVVRGLWIEAVGGTTVAQFINKRCRVDKRFLVPTNRAGYNIWNRQNAGLQVGSYVMANSRFCSIESAIMRIAGLFGSRVYSCNTPSLIPVSNGSPGNIYTMDSDVREFLVNRTSAEFGAPYILNETMLLPPLEFTAPPNCNIFLPPMYDKVIWQYDIDADATRGYYAQHESLSAAGGNSPLGIFGIQVPNSLFNTAKSKDNPDGETGSHNPYDKIGRHKPPLTLEERYKGVNVVYGSIETQLAGDDAAATETAWLFTKKAQADVQKRINTLQTKAGKASGVSRKPDTANLPALQRQAVDDEFKAKQDAIQAHRITFTGDPHTNHTIMAKKRHAFLKFLNSKYSGRVATIDMMFNPYPTCGFPGMIVDDEEAAGEQASKTIVGMVQQVKHLIYINPDSAEASTSIVMNNARFIDEAVDIDKYGNPLYMKATDPTVAEADPVTLQYLNPSYLVPEPKSPFAPIPINKDYDMAPAKDTGDYKYVKDMLSLTASQLSSGASNLIYLDQEYSPQFIARFYQDVLQHNQASFMIGKFNKGKQVSLFVYDTMHEAVTQLRKTRPELLYDYSEAMKFSSRRICSADAFYQAILGLSYKNDSEGKYVCNEPDDNGNIIYKEDQIFDQYYGVTTDMFKSDAMKNLRAPYGLFKRPGQFSSILEGMPITAFIQERRDAVETYITEASKIAQGMNFTQPTVTQAT